MHGAAYGTRILYMEDGKILAEMKLASMIKDDLKEREARIHEWLTSLNW